MYWETYCKVEMKPDSTKAFINRAYVSFDHEPNQGEIETELAKRYPEVNLVGVEWSRDMTHKAEYLMDYYDRKSFTGD
tara:strand:+ start:746 stop:979 length:234 start_codon:yes stop_codon:yes gene_type:complete